MGRCIECNKFFSAVPRGESCEKCELNTELGRLEAAMAAGYVDDGDSERVAEINARLTEIAELEAVD